MSAAYFSVMSDRSSTLRDELTEFVRRHGTALGVAALAAAVSTYVGLGRQGPVARLDVLLRRFPFDWLSLAAILWPVFVVWGRGGSCRGPGAQAGHGPRDPGAVVLASRTAMGGAWFLGAVAGGVAAGVVTSLSLSGLAVVPGERFVLTAGVLACQLATLYLLASVPAVLSRRPILWILSVPAVLVANFALARGLDLETAEAIHRWVAFGHTGPGTFMEAPAIAGGLVLEYRWQGMSPWMPTLFWLGVAVTAVSVALVTASRHHERRDRP